VSAVEEDEEDMLVSKTLGEDFVGSVRIGLAWCRDSYRWMKPVAIRLHPLDQYLEATKWPYGWPPLVVDEKTPRQTAVIELADPDRAEQLTLL